MGLLKGQKRGVDAQTERFELWGQRGWYNVDVVGESYHAREIRTLFPKGHDDRSVQLTVPVGLVHNPHNIHDSNAVEIQASTGSLGCEGCSRQVGSPV